MVKYSLNKKKTTKAIILRKLLTKELIEEGFYEKSDLEKDLRGIITKSQLEFHLYSRQEKEKGLITKGLVRSDRGKLSLNLKSRNAIAEMIGYLGNEPEIGPNVRYFFEKAFIEAFLSNYGDRFLIRLDLYQYLERGNVRTKSLLDREVDREIRQESNHFEEMNIKLGELEKLYKQSPIDFKTRALESEKITEKMRDNDKLDFSSARKQVIEGLPTPHYEAREEDHEELITALIKFAWGRRNLTVQFMLDYILSVVEISREVEQIEKNWDRVNKADLYERYEFGDFALFNKNEKEIRASSRGSSPQALQIFINGVIRKAIKASTENERYSSENDNLLSLFTGRIALSSFIMKSFVFDELPIYFSPPGIPSTEELTRIMSNTPDHSNIEQEVSGLVETLVKHRTIRENIMNMQSQSIVDIIIHEMDILGVTEEFCNRAWPELRRKSDELS